MASHDVDGRRAVILGLLAVAAPLAGRTADSTTKAASARAPSALGTNSIDALAAQLQQLQALRSQASTSAVKSDLAAQRSQRLTLAQQIEASEQAIAALQISAADTVADRKFEKCDRLAALLFDTGYIDRAQLKAIMSGGYRWTEQEILATKARGSAANRTFAKELRSTPVAPVTAPLAAPHA